MDRNDAIKRFGVSYSVESVPFDESRQYFKSRLFRGIHNIRVIELLGNNRGPYRTADEAVLAAESDIKDKGP